MKKTGWFIILGILLLLAGGFFYLWFVWLPQEMAKEDRPSSEAPVLFDKDDYKIIEKDGEKFIEVEKVGLSAKVPEGWMIEYQQTPDVEPQYWINVSSPNITTTTSNILTNGCRMSITAGIEEKNNKEVREHIKLLKENPDIKPEDISYIYENYIFKVTEINNYDILNWLSPEHNIIGQTIGIDVPIENKKLIDIIMAFPPGHKGNCFPTWEEFINNIEIK